MNNKLKSLVKFNKYMGTFHLIQAVFMLAVALSVEKVVNFKPLIVSNFLEYNNIIGRLVTVTKEVFNLPFGI